MVNRKARQQQYEDRLKIFQEETKLSHLAHLSDESKAEWAQYVARTHPGWNKPKKRSIVQYVDSTWTHVWRVLVILLLLLLYVQSLRGQQPHDPIIIRVMDGATTLATRQSGLVQIQCSTGMSCTWGSNTFTMTSAATGGGTSAALYYPHSEPDALIANYQQLLDEPCNCPEDTITAEVDSGTGEVQLGVAGTPKSFITLDSVPNSTVIPGGPWEFITYVAVDSAVGETRLIAKVYSRTVGGVETELFTTESAEFNNPDVARLIFITVQNEFFVAATDRVVVKFFVQTTSNPTRTVTLYYEGAENYTHVHTPLVFPTTASNVGGGTFYWFYTKLGRDFQFYSFDVTAPLQASLALNKITFSIPVATSLADGYLSSADWSTFNGKQDALGFTPEQQLTFNSPLSRAVNTIDCPTCLTSSTAAGGALSGTYPNPVLANLTTVGQFPYISSTGVLSESSALRRYMSGGGNEIIEVYNTAANNVTFFRIRLGSAQAGSPPFYVVDNSDNTLSGMTSAGGWFTSQQQGHLYFNDPSAHGRWITRMDTAEAGGDSGSDFFFYRYADDGSYLGSPLWFKRSTGVATFAQTIAGSINGNAGTATALAADPPACPANQWVIDIAANGGLTCSQPASTELSDTAGLVRGAASLATVNALPKVASAGVLTESMISCTGSPLTCTVYDPTATTGKTTLTVRAGVGQSTTRLFDIFANDGTTARFHVDAAGNVGIGVEVPSVKLEVVPDTFSSGAVSPIVILEARVADGLAESGGYIGFRQVDAGNSKITNDAARIAVIHEVQDVALGNTGLAFYTSPAAGSATERVRIDRNGNVGIGTTGPQALLDVVGNALLSGDNKRLTAGKWVTVSGGSSGAGTVGQNFYVDVNQFKYVQTHATIGYAGLLFSPPGLVGGIKFVGGSGATTQDAVFVPNVNMSINSSGDVGIGKTPTTKLDVAGTATATGFAGPLTGAVTGNASTATALAADPTDCSANQFSNAIAANGNLTCAAISQATPSWTDLTLQNGWTHTAGGWSNAGCSVNALNEIYLRGKITAGTITDGTLLFTLPVGCRPAGNVFLLMLSYDGVNYNIPVGISIASSGETYIYGLTVAGSSIYLFASFTTY